MNTYLNYLIEVNIGLVLFLGAYALMLRNETDFKIQRIFLLASILLSLTFPLLHLQLDDAALPSFGRLIPTGFTSAADIEGNVKTSENHNPPIDVWFYIQLLYTIGLAFFLIRFLIRFTSLAIFIKKATTFTTGKLIIVETEKAVPTFSFFHFIVVGQANLLSPEEKQKIVLHEAVHARQLHSFDILLINVLSIFFWFNPLLHTYKKIFVQLHEFEADAGATENHNVNEYCGLLAKLALKTACFKLANHFNNSLILKRIEMMRTIKHKIKRWKMLTAAAIIPVAFMLVACQDQLISDEATLVSVDEEAMPEGGIGTFYRHLGMHLKYPEEARQKRITGIVLVEFIVNLDGSVEVTGVSGTGGGLDVESMRVVGSSPPWKPARKNGIATKEKRVVPVVFRLIDRSKINESEIPPGAMNSINVVAM